MNGMAHIVLQLTLCSRMARAGPQATLPIEVRLTDRYGHTSLQKSFSVVRGEEPVKTVEFDSLRGVYFMQVVAPKQQCAADDFVSFLPDRTRSIPETMAPSSKIPPTPFLMQGTAPISFLYAKPSVVLFGKSTTCDKQVDDPLPADIRIENDRDSYYVSMTADPSVQSRIGVIALSLQTATGENHYIRVPVPFEPPAAKWPSTVQFNVTDDVMDSIAGKPVDTLLCPKLYKTSVG